MLLKVLPTTNETLVSCKAHLCLMSYVTSKTPNKLGTTSNVCFVSMFVLTGCGAYLLHWLARWSSCVDSNCLMNHMHCSIRGELHRELPIFKHAGIGSCKTPTNNEIFNIIFKTHVAYGVTEDHRCTCLQTHRCVHALTVVSKSAWRWRNQGWSWSLFCCANMWVQHVLDIILMMSYPRHLQGVAIEGAVEAGFWWSTGCVVFVRASSVRIASGFAALFLNF